ncbi:hypothetical protein G9A89_006708 [Geosiphon pyriformis]|nr:hypothetical protein G9A89_006708 [Geosiphon pyriformis]
MCDRFIRFFGGIHENRVNCVMTDFGLTKDYKVHDRLDQSEVKRHEHLCDYYIDTKFVLKTDRIKSCGGLTFYFAAGAFTSTQFALNIASEFFEINDISINSDKTSVKVASLSICGQPISIARKDEGLSKPSVVKAHSDPIVNYRIQFSFVLLGVCYKWNVMIREGLKVKTRLPWNFPDVTLHHLSLYGLKTFEQIQSEAKVAALVSFSNTSGIFGHLFNHRFLDLQVLGWAPLNPLQFPVKLHVSPVDNFLAGLVKILLDNELSLANNLLSAFCGSGWLSLFSILRKSLYFNSRLDSHGPVPYWFVVASNHLLNPGASLSGSAEFVHSGFEDITGSSGFSDVKDDLHEIWFSLFEVYTDGSLKDVGSAGVAGRAAVNFFALDHSVGVFVIGLLFSTMTELQAVALFLECVPSLSTVVLHLDSQAAINVCVSELSSAAPDFHNQCWIKRHHIFNLVKEKDLSISWVKVKGHSGIHGNVETDLVAGETVQSSFRLLAGVWEQFLVTKNTVVSDNACYFKAGPSFDVVSEDLIKGVNWVATVKVWHSDFYMLAGFTSLKSSNLHTYIMKAIHRQLLVAKYPGMLCLMCRKMELLDHVFTCAGDIGIHNNILVEASTHWSTLVGAHLLLSSTVLWVLLQCFSDVGLYTTVCKSEKAYKTFKNKEKADVQIVGFVSFIVELHRVKAWLVRSKHRIVIEKAGLVHDDSVVSGLFHIVSFFLSDGVVRLLGLSESFAVSFGHYKLYSFFFGLGDNVRVHIGM